MQKFSADGYFKQQADALSFDQALAIYNQIVTSQVADQATFQELWQDCLVAASRYVLIRNRWNTMTALERIQIDHQRTAAHNEWMNSLAILGRFLQTNDLPTPWLTVLGDRQLYRKRWGDFAGYLLLIGTLQAR